MEGGSQKGKLSCFWNNQENGKRETAQVEHFKLFLGHRLTYISMTVRFHCQISDCDTLSVLVTDILVGQCKQHTWTWIGWWLLRSSQYYGVWKEFIKGRCYETEALCIINSIWLEFRTNSLNCSPVLVRALDSPCIKAKTSHDTEQQIPCESIAWNLSIALYIVQKTKETCRPKSNVNWVRLCHLQNFGHHDCEEK